MCLMGDMASLDRQLPGLHRIRTEARLARSQLPHVHPADNPPNKPAFPHETSRFPGQIPTSLTYIQSSLTVHGSATVVLKLFLNHAIMHGWRVSTIIFIFSAASSLSAQAPSTQPSNLECANLLGNETCTECVAACSSAFILCAATCARRPAQCEVPLA